MKVKFRTIVNPDDSSQVFFMGMAYVKGQHRMTGVPFPPGADKAEAKKLIRRAFRKFQSE